MITFDRDGRDVVCKIKSPLPSDDDSRIGVTFLMRYECGDNASAELMRRHMQDRLDEAVVGIREAEYNQGWRDAKSRKVAKSTWFWKALLPVSSNGSDGFPDPNKWNWRR